MRRQDNQPGDQSVGFRRIRVPVLGRDLAQHEEGALFAPRDVRVQLFRDRQQPLYGLFPRRDAVHRRLSGRKRSGSRRYREKSRRCGTSGGDSDRRRKGRGDRRRRLDGTAVDGGASEQDLQSPSRSELSPSPVGIPRIPGRTRRTEIDRRFKRRQPDQRRGDRSRISSARR